VATFFGGHPVNHGNELCTPTLAVTTLAFSDKY